jgi:alpha-L-fucosidase
MYDNGLSDWTAVKMGPHGDLWGDLAKAMRAEGLHLGASSHHRAKVKAVTLLGVDLTVSFEQRADGLHIQLPERNPVDMPIASGLWLTRETLSSSGAMRRGREY